MSYINKIKIILIKIKLFFNCNLNTSILGNTNNDKIKIILIKIKLFFNCKLNISILGNTNNVGMCLASSLAKDGHKITLFLTDNTIGNKVNRPNSLLKMKTNNFNFKIRDFSKTQFKNYLYKPNQLLERIFSKILKVDLFILIGLNNSLGVTMNVPYVSILLGSDLLYFANPNSICDITKEWSKNYLISKKGKQELQFYKNFIYNQRYGIKKAICYSFCFKDILSEAELILGEIRDKNKKRFNFATFAISEACNLKIKKKFSSNDEICILNGARIVISRKNKSIGQIDLKATEILINGFTKFVKKGGKGKLILFEKGASKDIEIAKNLIKSNGIKTSVRWLKELEISKFLKKIGEVDIVADQLGDSFPGLVTADALAIGTPVMANMRNSYFAKYFGEIIPGINVKSAEDIAINLNFYRKNKDLLKEISWKGKEFYFQNLSIDKIKSQLFSIIRNN